MKIVKGDYDIRYVSNEKSTYLNTVNYDADGNTTVEIFNIETEDYLKLLREYILLRVQINYGETRKSIVSEIKQSTKEQFTGVTCGHEVMVFSDWRGTGFWLCGDGSIDGYCNYLKEVFFNLIKK